MDISRKEFFRQGLFSLGKTALELADTFTGRYPAVSVEPPGDVSSIAPRPDMRAEAFNERCLARSCGCFACVERCDAQAVSLRPGEGIAIDAERCTGCGSCEYVCPVEPKAVVLIPRK